MTGIRVNRPLPIADVWRETIAAARRGMAHYLPVAAAFVLLPEVVIDLFGPPLPKSPAGLTPNLVFVSLVLPSLIALVAQAAIVRLEVDRRGGIDRSVGEGLLLALRAWPLLVFALLLAAIPIGAGMLLIVPGLYLAGRLAMAMPLVLDGADPVAALRRSWELTNGNGWRVIGFTLLFGGWFILLSAAAATIGAGVTTLFAGANAPAVGAVLASTLGAIVAAVFTVFNAVGIATIYGYLRR